MGGAFVGVLGGVGGTVVVVFSTIVTGFEEFVKSIVVVVLVFELDVLVEVEVAVSCVIDTLNTGAPTLINPFVNDLVSVLVTVLIPPA